MAKRKNIDWENYKDDMIELAKRGLASHQIIAELKLSASPSRVRAMLLRWDYALSRQGHPANQEVRRESQPTVTLELIVGAQNLAKRLLELAAQVEESILHLRAMEGFANTLAAVEDVSRQAEILRHQNAALTKRLTERAMAVHSEPSLVETHGNTNSGLRP